MISIAAVNHDHKFDVKLHELMMERLGTARVREGAGTEWSIFPDMNPETLVRKAIQILENNSNAARESVSLIEPQIEALEDALKNFQSGKRTMLYELAPRFGKTIWALSILSESSENVMAVCSYVQTVFPSFEKEAIRFLQFEDIVVLDPRDANFNENFDLVVVRCWKQLLDV